MTKIVLTLVLALACSPAWSQFMGRFYWPNEASAQASADAIHACLYATDAAYKASVDAGQTLRWDVPHQSVIFIPDPPFAIPDPNDKRYYINTTVRCWGCLSAAQQTLITSGQQTFLLNSDRTNIMTALQGCETTNPQRLGDDL